MSAAASLASGPAAGRLVTLVRGAFLSVAVLAYVVMCLSVGIQILGRYVLNYPIAQFAEIATYAQVWLATMGSGYALRTGTLFAMDSLVAGLPLGLRRAVMVLNTMLALVFIGVLFYGSLFLLRIGEFQTSPSLGMPMWMIYLALPVSGVYLAFECVAALVERWRDPFAQHGPEMD